MPGQKLTPAQVARALRAKFPGQLDDLDDVQILRGLKAKDPATYADLMDPALEGMELLSPIRQPARPSMRAAGAGPVSAANLPPPPPPLPPSTGDQLIATGLRVVPSVAGSFGGPLIGAASGFVGEAAGQGYEYLTGQRKEFSPSVMATEAGLNAIPMGWTRRLGMAGRLAATAGQGAALSASSQAMRTGLEEGRLSTGAELLTAGGMGAGFGLGVGGAAEGIGAAARRAPSFGDSTGSLPTDVGPPPAPPDQLIMAQAASQLYEQEEARLAAQLKALYGERAAAGRGQDYHTALQAKDYLKQLKDLAVSKAEAAQVLESMGTAHAFDPLTASPYAAPTQPLLERGQFGDPNLVDPTGGGGRVAQTIVEGGGPPPTMDRLGGQLEQSLGAPPGPPRLTGEPSVLTREPLSVERGTLGSAPPLLDTAQFPTGRTRQTGEYQPPSGEARGRLPGIDEPQPLSSRPYTQGPNAGPRREGEAHGAPRSLRRQVKTGNQIRYESAPSTLRAEDPATYPAEVRRELAQMAWELENILPETVQGGSTRGQLDALTEVTGSISGAVAEAKSRGVTSGGRAAGAPVRKDILKAAEGSFAHATRAEMLQMIRGALLEGRGNGLTDAAAQVARRRLEIAALPPGEQAAARGQVRESRVRGGEVFGSEPVRAPFQRMGRGDEGDALIGWEDATGTRALPDQDLDDLTRGARDLDDGEVTALVRIWNEAGGAEGLSPDSVPHFEAARTEAVRRRLLEPEQLDLVMGGPGGDKGPSLLDFEGGPPQRPGQADLPGTEGVRDTNLPTPEVADLPFALTPPPSKPASLQKAMTDRRQGGLFEKLSGEEGVFIYNVPVGNREALKKWLQKQEAAEGGEAWFSRVEQAIEEGEWNRAFRVAAGASVRSVAAGYKNASTPEQRARISSSLRGTPLQDDLNTQIVAVGRKQSGLGTAPPVKDFPPSARISQAAGARAPRATLGPAGIIRPGPLQRPLPANSRSHIFGRPIITDILAATDPSLVHLIPGNQDRSLRLISQAADLAFQGKNTSEIKKYLNLSDQEIAQGYEATITEAARLLNDQQQWIQRNKAQVTRLANQMSMGAAKEGMLGSAPPRFGARVKAALYEELPTLTGGKGQAGIPVEEDPLIRGTRGFNRQMLVQQLKKRLGPESTMGQLVNAQISFLTSLPSTAVRNFTQFTARYTIDALDHAISVPLARALESAGYKGYGEFADITASLTKELAAPFKKGSLVTPLTSWKDTIQGIYDFESSALSGMHPKDVAHTLNLLEHVPDTVAHYMGQISEQAEQVAQKTPFPFLNHTVLDPKVQRAVALLNRAQEFTSRSVIFDAQVRARLHAKGLNPNEWLISAPHTKAAPPAKPGEAWKADPNQPNAYGHSFNDLVDAVGGQRAFETILARATDATLEATFAGATAKNSIPGELIKIVNTYWPVRLAYRFPAFNMARAPRWLYDHSPLALAELLRFPFDMYGLSPMGPGRLYRGVQALKNEQVNLPDLMTKLSDAEATQGRVHKEKVAVAREQGVYTRLVKRLERQAQAGLPGVQTKLDAAVTHRDQLLRQRARLDAEEFQARADKIQLAGREKTLMEDIRNAHGISAPNVAQYLARITTGTALLGAAVIIRSQEGADGTPWYKFRISELTDEQGNPETVDMRSYAPLAQYFFVGDVLTQLQKWTDWAGVQEDRDAGMSWIEAVTNRYEGKYTGASFYDELARAFFSISRPAGTSISLPELLTQNNWPDTQTMGEAVMGTLGQFIGGWTMPARIGRDAVGAFDEEENIVRIPPPSTRDEPFRPLAAPLANVPGLSRLIPETTSQTTGQPLKSTRPLLRGLGGITTSGQDFIEQERQRVGLSGQVVYIRKTGDVEYDTLVAKIYSQYLNEELPTELESAEYQSLRSPALQRDYLQQTGVFTRIKRWALMDVKDLLGEERVESVTITGEAARRRARQQRLVDGMLEELGPAPQEQEELAGEPPPAPPLDGPPAPPQ